MLPNLQGPARRAPRLGPDDRIAPHITPAGRFMKVDPLRPAKRPSVAKILGVLGWAVLTVESLRRAWSRSRQPGG